MNTRHEQIRRVWQDVLGIAEVRDEDDFFGIGGHSLTAMQVSVRLKEYFGVKIPTRLLFANRRFTDFAAAVDDRVTETATVGGS